MNTGTLISDDPIIIRYDGIDADHHEIELGALGESIKGLSRIIGVAANFAATQKYVQHKDAMAVRVLATPPKAHCFEIAVALHWVSQNALASTVVGGLTVSLVSYIFSRLAKNKAEMKELRGALETAIKELGNRDQMVIDRLLDTVDKMADALKPSARQAVSPIGATVSSMSVSSRAPHAKSTVIGIAEKETISASDPAEIIDEKIYHITIHEMNKDNVSCKISLDDDPDARIASIITDPEVAAPNNVYAMAFAADTMIPVKAKAAIRDGIIEKLYISDTVKK